MLRASSRSGVMAAVWVAVMLGLWLGGPQPAYAQRSLLEAAVHLKVLAYDRNLATDGRRRVTLAVLYPQDNDKAAKRARELIAAFRSLSRKVSVRGIPIAVVAIPVSAKPLAQDLSKELSAALGRANVDAIYVPASLSAHTSAIAQVAAKRKLPALCGSLSQLSDGLAVAVDMSGSKPQLVVNLPAARKFGMNLSARLLRMARVVK